jgi:hypothetical protein
MTTQNELSQNHAAEMKERHLQIAVHGAAEIWRDFAATSLAGLRFSFLPSLFNLSPGDRSAEFSLNFVSADPMLTTPIDLPPDPFTSVFAYFYVVRIGSGQTIPAAEIARIERWIGKRNAMSCQWYVYVFQESGPLFSPQRPSALFSLPEVERRSTVICFRAPLRLIDFSIESFRAELQQRVTESLGCSEIAISRAIRHQTSTGLSAFSLALSRSLLFFYFGFFRTAAALFEQNYEILRTVFDDNFWVYGIPVIEPHWITHYPTVCPVNIQAMLIFAVCGKMASYFAFNDGKGFMNAFLRHYAILRDRCRSDEQEVIVRNWIIQSLTVILESIPLESSVSFQFWFNLFIVRLHEKSLKVHDVYQHLVNHIQMQPYLLEAANFLHSEGCQVSTLTRSWSLGATAFRIILNDAIDSGNISALEYSTPMLLEHRQVSQLEKQRLIAQLLALKLKLTLKCRRPLTVFAMSSRFGVKIARGEMVSMKAKIIGHLFLNEFESIRLHFTSGHFHQSVLKRGNISVCHRFFEFDLIFEELGDWSFDQVEFAIEDLSFVWPLLCDLHFSVCEIDTPAVSVVFPEIFALSSRMTMYVDIQYATFLLCRLGQCEISLSFERFATISDQSGETELNDLLFRIQNNVLSFEGTPIPSPEVRVPIEFIPTIPLDSVLIVVLKFQDNEFEHTFPVDFRFPLQWTTRYLTANFAQVSLRNILRRPMQIRRFMTPSVIGEEQTIAANDEMHMLLDRGRTQEQRFKFIITVDSVSVEKYFPIDSRGPSLILDAGITDRGPYPIGLPVALRIPVPDQCSVRVAAINPVEALIVGPIVSQKLQGTLLCISVIPLQQGIVRLPIVTVNNVTYALTPELIEVCASQLPLISPFLRDDQFFST